MSSDDRSQVPIDQKAAALLRDVFSRHGDGFHFAVTNAFARLQHAGRSPWMLEAVEFPVDVQGITLHIDIVLRNVQSNAVAVVECKRVNPALGTWCFGKSGYAAARRMPGGVALEGAIKPADSTTVHAFRPTTEHTDHQYNVAREVKTDVKGDPHGSGRGALTDAISQALRSGSGIIRAACAHEHLLGRDNRFVVVPVIVTTAKLLACNTDLSVANINSGDLPSELDVIERRWLWYRTVAAVHVRHGLSYFRKPPQFTNFGELLDADYARSIGVVTPAGLEEFCGAASYQTGGHW